MRIPNWLKAGAYSALWAFIGVFGLGITGWLLDVLNWANSKGEVEFPDVSTVGYLLVAAVVGAVIGLVATVVRFAQSRTGTGEVPQYATEPKRRPYRGD
jgi:H+/Cl- antiporter ClcA